MTLIPVSMRKPLLYALTLVVMWYGFAVSVHASEHPFHKHVESCDVLVAAEKNGACPPAFINDSPLTVSCCQASSTGYLLVLQSPPHTLYLTRAPPLARLRFC